MKNCRFGHLFWTLSSNESICVSATQNTKYPSGVTKYRALPSHNGSNYDWPGWLGLTSDVFHFGLCYSNYFSSPVTVRCRNDILWRSNRIFDIAFWMNTCSKWLCNFFLGLTGYLFKFSSSNVCDLVFCHSESSKPVPTNWWIDGAVSPKASCRVQWLSSADFFKWKQGGKIAHKIQCFCGSKS